MKETSIDENKKEICFVLSPFEERFNDNYIKILQPSIIKAGMIPLRADEIYGARPIMHDILNSIRSARIVLAEMTGRNPNVLYEVGLSHALGKSVIMITQSEDDIPFDLKAIRYIPYKTIKPDWAEDLSTLIIKNLLSTLRNETDTVFYKELEEVTPYANPVASWMPNALHHVSLPVSDLEKSKAFYRDDLGLQEMERPELYVNGVKLEGAWFWLPSGQQLHLLLNSSGTFRKNADDNAYRDCHFALRVRDFREMRNRLSDKYHLHRIPEITDDRYAHFYVLDPDDHVIEINTGNLPENKPKLKNAKLDPVA